MKKFLLITGFILTAMNANAAAPTVDSISPAMGPELGGTTVVIIGMAFTGATAVKFGGVDAASYTVDDDGTITCTSPAGTGIVHVTVSIPAGTSPEVAGDQFTYIEQSATYTPTATGTVTETITDTITVTGTHTPPATATGTAEDTFTATHTPSVTGTASPAITNTNTPTGSASSTPTETKTATITLTLTLTRTGTATRTVSPTFTITGTATPTATVTVTLTPYITPTIEESLYEKMKGTLYPNPVKSGASLYMIYDFNDSYGVKITIYTLDGRKAKEIEAGSLSGKGRLAMDTAGLAPGVYIYKTTITYINTMMIVGAESTTEETVKKLVITK